jgi:hypothetical protein
MLEAKESWERAIVKKITEVQIIFFMLNPYKV